MASIQIFRSHLKTPFLFLLIIEAGVVFAMVYSANFIRFHTNGQDSSLAFHDLQASAVVISLVTSICILSTGLYVGKLREGMSGVLIRIGLSLVMSSVVVVIVFYLVPDIALGRGVLAIAYIQAFFIN